MGTEIPLDTHHNLRLPTDVAVAPDGDRVAFVADESDPTADDPHSALYVAPTDGSRDPHRLTHASDAGTPVWGPDGDRLAFLATREEDIARKQGREHGADATDDAESGDIDDADDADDTDDTDADDTDDTDADDADDTDADDEPNSQVWCFDLTRGGDARQLTAFDEGVREFDWAPDGERLVVAARDPTDEQAEYLQQRRDDGPIETERLQHKFDGVGWLDDVRTYLFVVEAGATGGAGDGDADTDAEPRRLDDAYGAGASEPMHGLQPAWGPSDRIAFVRNDGEDPDDSMVVDVLTVDPDGSDLRVVSEEERRCSNPAWSPDGDRLTYAGGNPTNWYEPTEVFVAPDADDAEPRSVSGSLDRTIARSGAPRWVDDETLLCPFADEGWTRLVELDAERDAPSRTFESQRRDTTVEGFDLAGDTAAVVLSGPQIGSDVYAVDVDGETETDTDSVVTQLSDLNRDFLDAYSQPDCERVEFENSDGETVEAIVYVPDNFDREEPEPAPTIAAIHGGPMSYDAPTFRFTHAYWASRGYLVVRVNYRGSTSYGREFSESLKGSRGDLESDDVISGVDAVVDRGWADPDRLFVTGFSYGGITTAHVVTRTDTFAAAAPEHGIYDFYATFGTDDNHNWHDWEFGVPWAHVDDYREASSLTDVGEIDTPLLVTAGEQDWRCPPSQAEQLYVSVKKQGVPARLVIYPDEHHNIGDPQRATHRIDELTSWFERHDPAVDAE